MQWLHERAGILSLSNAVETWSSGPCRCEPGTCRSAARAETSACGAACNANVHRRAKLSAGQARGTTLLRERSAVDVASDCCRECLSRVGLIDNLGGARQQEPLSQIFGE